MGRSRQIEQRGILPRVERRWLELSSNGQPTQDDIRHENTECCEGEAEGESREDRGAEGSSSRDFTDEMRVVG